MFSKPLKSVVHKLFHDHSPSAGLPSPSIRHHCCTVPRRLDDASGANGALSLVFEWCYEAGYCI